MIFYATFTWCEDWSHEIIKYSYKQKRETILIHCGAIDLGTEKDHVKTANNILKWNRQCKTENNNMMVSGPVSRNDNLNDYVIWEKRVVRETLDL